MKKLEMLQDLGIKEDERLYVIGNGFDVHHNCIICGLRFKVNCILLLFYWKLLIYVKY